MHPKRSSSQLRLGAPKILELLDIPVEQFFTLIHFEDRERLEDLIKLTSEMQELWSS